MSEDLEVKSEVGNEAVTTAAIEGDAPHITSVIEDRFKSGDKPVTTEMIVNTLKRIESVVRKNYPDPDRIVTEPVNPHRMVIHQDFRRDVPPIPHHVTNPRVALVAGKPIEVSSVTVPEVRDHDGVVVRSAYNLPVYAAADADGKPWKDSRGEYVVIDPQNGTIRQRMKSSELTTRHRRSWWQVKLIRLKCWWKSLRFDFKIIKRV